MLLANTKSPLPHILHFHLIQPQSVLLLFLLQSTYTHTHTHRSAVNAEVNVVLVDPFPYPNLTQSNPSHMNQATPCDHINNTWPHPSRTTTPTHMTTPNLHNYTPPTHFIVLVPCEALGSEHEPVVLCVALQ